LVLRIKPIDFIISYSGGNAMEHPKGIPMVVPANGGRKMFVLGNEVRLKISSSESGGDLYVFEALTPPGAVIPPHVHRHEDEFIHVIEGEYEIFLDGRTYVAGPGAVINFPRLIPHGFRNISKKQTRALFTVVPGKNFEKFFEQPCALPADEPPDMATVTEIFKRYGMDILEPPLDIARTA
jgi:quercetin dioxygenase-like cupin family protein